MEHLARVDSKLAGVDHLQVAEKLRRACEVQPPRLELLFCDILDLERSILFRGRPALSWFARQPAFWDVLRRSYDAHCRVEWTSFKRLLACAAMTPGIRGSG